MTEPPLSRLMLRLQEKAAEWQDDWQLSRTAGQAAAKYHPENDQRPVVFFQASTGILRLSLNSAFGLLASWALGQQGVPVIHFVCQEGMSRCVLGTNREDAYQLPPCSACMRHSRARLKGQNVRSFRFKSNPELSDALKGLSLPELEKMEYAGLPLGQIALPSLRWILRRHYLPDEEPIRFLMREYIVSAYQVAQDFTALLDENNPQAVVLYNGMFFPEAIAKRLAESRGIRVITHEVALRPFTAFFTTGEATAYPIHIPEDFELSAEQNARLDATLEQRFKGNFSMAGIRFWPDMRGLDESFLQKFAQFKQIVPVFTNVIFDTSQVHANTTFPDMFAWLDVVLKLIRSHTETLFVIRAHPDEMRPNKESRDSVRNWVEKNKVQSLPNVLFVDSGEALSSYDLISRSKFVMVYNSSIGLEASIMGAAVLCGGKARYTQYPTVFYPATQQEYSSQAEQFLEVEKIEVPAEFRHQARRFLYYQFFKTSLPFGDYLEEQGRPGFVRLRDFDFDQLLPEHSVTMQVIVNGILQGSEFILPETGE